MPYPHPIRLRGPWLFGPLSRGAIADDGQIFVRSDNLPAAGRGAVPADWGETLGRDFRGRVRYRRSFNPPATLDSHERLWLVIEGVDARGSVTLNGARLGDIHGYALWASFDVTSLVARRNEIILDVELPARLAGTNASLRPGREALPGGPIGEIRLEVRSAWFVESLAVWSLPDGAGRRFMVAGRIAGEPAETPLAVVIGGGERELAYHEAQSGETFELMFAAPDFPVWTSDRPLTAAVEVKLLAGGAAVWQAARQTSLRAAVVNAGSTRLEQILSEAAYADFDRRGVSVIQHVPLAWAEQVCPRLAHHPCIAAWSAGSETPAASTPTYGREWV